MLNAGPANLEPGRLLLQSELSNALYELRRSYVFVRREMIGNEDRRCRIKDFFRSLDLLEFVNGQCRRKLIGQVDVNPDHENLSRTHHILAGVSGQYFLGNRHSHGTASVSILRLGGPASISRGLLISRI